MSERAARAPGAPIWRPFGLLVLGIALSLVPRLARADTTIVLHIEPTGGTEAVRARAEDEVRAAGFVVRSGQDDSTVAVVSLTRVALDAEGSDWTIAVEDRVTGKRSERAVRVTRGEDEAARVALLAVELLYASWLELQTAPIPNGSVPAPPVVRREVRRRLAAPLAPARWSVSSGMNMLASPGALGHPSTLSLGLTHGFAQGLRLSLEGWLTPTATILTEADASARIRLYALRANARLEVRPRARLSPSFGLGAGWLLVRARGQARAPLEASTEQGMVGWVGASSELAYRVAPRLRLRATGNAGLSVPEVKVRFAGERVARAGRPLMEMGAGAEWVFR